MALVNKVPIQGGSDNTAPVTGNHPYISHCRIHFSNLYLAAIGMLMCEWRCVISATLYVYFVDHLYILLISTKSFFNITCLCHFYRQDYYIYSIATAYSYQEKPQLRFDYIRFQSVSSFSECLSTRLSLPASIHASSVPISSFLPLSFIHPYFFILPYIYQSLVHMQLAVLLF